MSSVQWHKILIVPEVRLKEPSGGDTVRFIIAMLLLLPALAQCGEGQSPVPPDAELVAAWKKLPARFCWLNAKDGGYWAYRNEGKPGDLPAFCVPEFKAGVIGKLPSPALPFALDLTGTKITDDGLSELAGFEHLQRLNLQGTAVSSEGLKAL